MSEVPGEILILHLVITYKHNIFWVDKKSLVLYLIFQCKRFTILLYLELNSVYASFSLEIQYALR